MSALPPKADIGRQQDVRFVPIGDISQVSVLNRSKKRKTAYGGLSEIRSGVLTRRLRCPLYFFQLFSCAPITAVRSGTEPGNLVIGGNAALRRQLVNKSWQNFRQLRRHVLFGHTGLFGQGLDK